MIRRPPRSTLDRSSAASDVYKRRVLRYFLHTHGDPHRAFMDTITPENEHVVVERSGAIVTVTFNRPEARNAMTWAMYQRLYDACEEVDADDAVRVLVLKGAGGKAFVAGTDIGQFTQFQGGEDGLR